MKTNFNKWRVPIGWLWLATCLGAAGYFLLLGVNGPPDAGRAYAGVATGPTTRPVSLRTPPPTVRKSKPIEMIHVGERVAGRNPDRTDVDLLLDEPNSVSWRLVVLEMEKAGGGVLDIELLRPVEWLEFRGARPGATVFLDLPEMEAVGDAHVVSVTPSPDVKPGPGRVVTGTFAHPVTHNVLNLFVEGEPQPVGVTAHHLFWSETQQTFVSAGSLVKGEELRGYSGDAMRVVNVLPRPGPTRVYNIEVQSEHVYHVSTSGLLVHNCSDGLVFRGDDDVLATTNSRGLQKSFINGAGDMVPASTSGLYKGRPVTAGEVLVGGFRSGPKNHSPFTSFSRNQTKAASWGTEVVGLDLPGLRKAIRAGDVTGVAILNQRQLQRLIRQNQYFGTHFKKMASNFARGNEELLVYGTIPERFILRNVK